MAGHFVSGLWVDDPTAILEMPEADLRAALPRIVQECTQDRAHGERRIIRGLSAYPLVLEMDDPETRKALHRINRARFEATWGGA